jgi:hypothetical protein
MANYLFGRINPTARAVNPLPVREFRGARAPAGSVNRWRHWRRRHGRAPTGALPRFQALLWIDLPASGLDVAGFVAAVQDWREGEQRPLVVLAHDLAWREDAGHLAGPWDAPGQGRVLLPRQAVDACVLGSTG